jgi:hypothetical protein
VRPSENKTGRQCPLRHRSIRAALNLPTYGAGINPLLTATLDGQGNVTRVTINYPRDAVGQYLRYGSMYRR